MTAHIRSLLVTSLACLVITGIGLLGYASYNSDYASGYDYTLGYEYGCQTEAKYNEGYNCGYKVAYPETAVLSEDAGSTSPEVVLKNPTFKELRDFILRDPTSSNKFVLNQYECRHFATDVNNNADSAGLRCAFVLLCFDQGQHAVIAFETTDRGLIYIEPQTDAAIHPEVGGSYQGKEIKEILIAW